MRFVSRPAGLMFLIAFTLLSIVAFVLACGPSAPPVQNPPEGAKTQPTPTPEVFYAYVNNTRVPFYKSPPLPTPPNDKVQSDLRVQVLRYQSTREAQQTRGIAPTGAPPNADVTIRVRPQHGAAVFEMLIANGSTIEHYTPAYDEAQNTPLDKHPNAALRNFAIILTSVPISTILDLEADDRILKVKRTVRGTPLGPSSSIPLQSTMAAFIAQFHEAGYTGAGIEIGIIDEGFVGFSQITRSATSPAPTVLCFRDARSPIHSQLQH